MKQKLIGALIVIALLFAFGVRASHPVDGLQSAMGSAKSSVVIYKHAGDYAVGQKVIVDVAGQGAELGVVKSASEETVDVDTRSAFVRVAKKDVHGKLLVVIPFFGTLLNLVGL